MNDALMPEAGREVPSALARTYRVLVVDDQDEIRSVLARMLRALGHEVEFASDGLEALAKIGLDIDLVLLDAGMPHMDGLEVARRIRSDSVHSDLPIIMITGQNSQEDRLRAVEAGCNDFIAKPFELTELKVRSASLLKMKTATDAVKRHGVDLEETVARRTLELRRALDQMAWAQQSTVEAHHDTIRRLVIAAEFKDRDTAAHIERIGLLSEVVARGLGLRPGEVEMIRHAAPMHDVGKIGIPDAILLKPGPLDEAESRIMRQHTAIGARILHGSPSPLLQLGESIALSHHERWDGGGYPEGLGGEAIPLAGRICAVADVFDALTSDRSYREALPHAAVYEMMKGEDAGHFDPHVLDIFLQQRGEIEAIQRGHRAVQPALAISAEANPKGFEHGRIDHRR